MKPHPASELFPPMTDSELADLAEDIRAHGLLDPIVLLDGMILDGRNRLRACEMVDIEPRFVEWAVDGISPLEWVVAHNLKRRNLTIAQRAAIALDLLPMLEAEADDRRRKAGTLYGEGHPKSEVSPQTDEALGRATAKAAEMVGIGRTSVENTKLIAARAPEIIEQMRTGDTPSIAAAAREAGFEQLGQGHRKGGAPALGSQPIYFGRGDKFRESTEPLTRYLAAWRKRGFEFRHLRPREAAKRVQVIDALVEGLVEARADLEPRSHVSKLTI